MINQFEEVLRRRSVVDPRSTTTRRNSAVNHKQSQQLQDDVDPKGETTSEAASPSSPQQQRPSFRTSATGQPPKVELTKVELRFFRRSIVLYCDKEEKEEVETDSPNLTSSSNTSSSDSSNFEDDEDDLFYIFDPSDDLPEEVPVMTVEQYAAKRVMSKTQEKWNAITMVPPSLYCIYFSLSAAWIRLDPNHAADDGFASQVSTWVAETTGCLEAAIVPAVPPLTVLAVVIGTCLHMPFSFVYHWKYAHTLTGSARINHWSRRMDQSMIHFNSAMMAFAASGSFRYFFVCALFNLDCARHHFQPYFRPLSNQIRVALSILAYSLPLVVRGDWDKFGLFWLIWGLAIWLFSQYPIGGWSHSAFHLSVGFLAPLMMSIALEMPSSQPQLVLAAQCIAATTAK